MPTRLQTHIDAFLDDLQNIQARSRNTLLAYRNDLGQFSTFVQQHPSIDGVPQAGFAPAHVTAWHMALEVDGRAPATIARKMAALSSLTAWLAAQGVIDRETASRLAPGDTQGVANTHAIERMTSPDEVARLLATVAEDISAQGVRDRALIAAIAMLGMRVGEVAQLDLADVDTAGKRLRSRPRRNAPWLALRAPADAILARYLSDGRPHLQVDPDEPALFLNHRGKRITRQGIWLIIKRHVEAAGIAGEVTPQTLRRTWLQGEIDRGLSPQAYAERAGTSPARSKRDYKRAAQSATGASIVVDGVPYRLGDADPDKRTTD